MNADTCGLMMLGDRLPSCEQLAQSWSVTVHSVVVEIVNVMVLKERPNRNAVCHAAINLSSRQTKRKRDG